MTGLQQSHREDRADFDWRKFSTALRAKNWNDPRGIRAIGEAIGVTASDMSRAMGGQAVSVGKAIALCDWLERELRDFYIAPEPLLVKAPIPAKSECCSRPNVKQEARR